MEAATLSLLIHQVLLDTPLAPLGIHQVLLAPLGIHQVLLAPLGIHQALLAPLGIHQALQVTPRQDPLLPAAMLSQVSLK